MERWIDIDYLLNGRVLRWGPSVPWPADRRAGEFQSLAERLLRSALAERRPMEGVHPDAVRILAIGGPEICRCTVADLGPT
jgi:hypothetical protein